MQSVTQPSTSVRVSQEYQDARSDLSDDVKRDTIEVHAVCTTLSSNVAWSSTQVVQDYDDAGGNNKFSEVAFLLKS